MRISSWLPVVAVGCALILQAFSIPAKGQGATDVLSYHGNTLASNGVNTTEGKLTPGTVNVGVFGKQFSVDITDVPNLTGIPISDLPSAYNYSAPAGQVYAEPLVKTGVPITDANGNPLGVHDVVFVATSMDSLFAIDANSGAVLWKDSFIYNASGNPNPKNATIPAGVTAVPGGDGTEIETGDINPWVGIVGTPVIDGTNGYIYLVAKTREARVSESQPDYVLTLHKVSLANGADTPVVIANTTLNTADTTYAYNSGPYVLGTGPGAITALVNGVNQSVIYFNAVRQMVRPALELYGGRIFIASASHGDNGPYHGWILTYDITQSTPVLNGVWNATPNGTEGQGGIWQGGGGVTIDANGNIYFETGNGDFDGYNTNGTVTGVNGLDPDGVSGFPVNGNYGDCFVKLVTDSTTSQQTNNLNGWGLKVVDYFSPYNNHVLDQNDWDLDSGGPIVLPDSAGSTAHPHLLVGGGKQGTLYLIDRDNMGKFGVTDNVVQSVLGSADGSNGLNGLNGLFSVPSYFNGTLYATSAFGGGSGIPNLGYTSSWPLSNATIGSIQSSPEQFSFPGATSYITANRTANGVLWIINNVENGTGQLRAYDPTNLAPGAIWTSEQNSARDSLGLDSTVKFSVPTPANGRVYVGTADHLVVYGPVVPPDPPTNLTAGATTASSIFLAWTDNSNNESGFAIERSSDDIHFTQIATVGANVTQYGDTGLSSPGTYYYQVRAFNTYNGTSYSIYTNVDSATTLATGVVAPVDLYHFDEGMGLSTVDSGAGGNNGALVGASPNSPPTWVLPGHIGNACLSFSGLGSNPLYNDDANQESAVQVPNDLSPILGQTSSIMFWINTTQTGNDTHYLAPAVTGVDEVGGGNDINWGYLDGEGRIGIAVGDSGTLVSTNPINDGTWHHIAMTRDAVAGDVYLYVDGVQNGHVVLGTGAKTTPFNLIGAMSVYGSFNDHYTTYQGATYFNGELDDVQIFNTVVDLAYVQFVALAPGAPTYLDVTPASGTELDLTWTNNATNATGYEVWSSVNGGSFARIAQLPANATSYPATGLTSDTPYSFYVVAVNSVGSSAESNTVNTATPAPPAAPTNPAANVVSDTEIDLTWTDNATNETGYQILRRTGTNPFVVVASLPAYSIAYQDTSVFSGTTYDYEIEVDSLGGTGVATVSATTPGPPPLTITSYLSRYEITDPTGTADPNNIGIRDLLAYAFDINPTVSSDPSGLPVVTAPNGYLVIKYLKQINASDIAYTVQVSYDLINWSADNATPTITANPNDANTEYFTVQDNVLITTPNVHRFIRVQVSQVTP